MMPYRNPLQFAPATALNLFILLIVSVPAFGSSGPWLHIATAHFGLSYTPSTSHLVEEAAQIAEDTRRTLTEYFGDAADLRFISIVLSDDSDEPNGGASTSDSVVWIDSRKTQSLFRGETDWLRTVLTHELSHQYSLHPMKPLILVKPVENIRITGENFRLTMNTNQDPIELPHWFVEGLAQMGSRKAEADSHDAIRRMVLREAAATESLLSLEDMGRFEGTQRDQELVYNQGFSLLQYLETTYPEVNMARLCTAAARSKFTDVFPELYGKPLSDLYNDWRSSLKNGSDALHQSKGVRLFDKVGAMVVETSEAGPYVVANWGNDDNRFGLFHKETDGMRLLARDVGPAVRSESPGKGVWYTQQTFNFASGTMGYEVYHLDDKGRSRQITQESRVLAFDVLDDHLAYARYRAGQTDLVVRRPDATETIVGRAPRGTAVYSVSMINLGTLIVTVGTGPRVNAAVVTQGTWSRLWPDAEVMDLVSAGEDQVVFTSTLEGSPQLYWADLAREPGTWYPITRADWGARFPSWDSQGSRLSYSEYREGGWRRMVLGEALKATAGIKVPGPTVAAWPPQSPGADNLEYRREAANPVVHVEPVSAGLLFQKGAKNQAAALASASWSATVFNAPRDWSASAAYSIQSVFDLSIPSQPAHDVVVGGTFQTGPVSNAITWEMEAESQYFNKYGYPFLTYTYWTLHTESTLLTAKDQWLTLTYQGRWSVHTTRQPAETFLGLIEGELRWNWSSTTSSVFDPARLGQSGQGGYLAGRLLAPQILDPLYWDNTVVLMNNEPVPRVTAAWGGRYLWEGSRLSVGCSLMATASPGAIKNSLVFPWALTDLQSVGFIGYPADYAPMVYLGLCRLSLATNPLVVTTDATQWFERLGLGVSVQAGAGQYYDPMAPGRIGTGYPVSAEVTFTAAFPQAPDHFSSAKVGLAMAFNDFAAASKSTPWLPFQFTVQYDY